MKDFDVGAGQIFATTQAGLIHSSINGGASTTLIDYADTEQYESGKLRTNGTYVAYVINTSLLRAKVDGSDVQTLATDLTPAVVQVAIDATYVYYATGSTVERVALASGTPPQVLASGLGAVQGIALDASNVYFSVLDDNAKNEGTVRVVPKAGGTVSTVVTRSPYPRQLLVDADAIYFADKPGFVSKVAKP